MPAKSSESSDSPEPSDDSALDRLISKIDTDIKTGLSRLISDFMDHTFSRFEPLTKPPSLPDAAFNPRHLAASPYRPLKSKFRSPSPSKSSASTVSSVSNQDVSKSAPAPMPSGPLPTAASSSTPDIKPDLHSTSASSSFKLASKKSIPADIKQSAKKRQNKPVTPKKTIKKQAPVIQKKKKTIQKGQKKQDLKLEEGLNQRESKLADILKNKGSLT